MAKSLSRVLLIGRAGRDPQVRRMPDGGTVATFSLATDRPAKPSTETEPDWHRVVCWARIADRAARYVGKGRLVCVVGRLTYRDWESRDGQRHHTAEVVASDLVLLDRPPGSPAATEDTPVADDEVPF